MLAAGAALSVAGCSGGGASLEEPASRTPAKHPPPTATRTVRVLDLVTARPLRDARVVATGPAGRTVHRTDAEGRVEVPVNTRRVRGQRRGYSDDVEPLRRHGLTVLGLSNRATESRQYGVGPARTRYNPRVRAPLPTGRRAWVVDAKRLVEFPPVVGAGILVVGTNAGRVIALNARTGKRLWTRKRPGAIASSPAIEGDLVYVTSMDGTLTAFGLRTGRIAWRFDTDGSPSESSPLVVDGLVYAGAWNGTLYAVDATTGRLRWRSQTGADIKAGAAYAGGNVVVGNYSGAVVALDPRTGQVAWRSTVGARLYGGVGVHGGVLVVGDVGGQVVAVDAATGRVMWRHQTGGYVYSSPAIAHDTVFIGSYSGRFEALDLHTGRTRWSVDAGGRISGSATVVGDTVYTSVLAAPGAARRTLGLATATGAIRYRGDDGRYSPAVAAGDTLYLVGVRRIEAYRRAGARNGR
ncbi:MAG: PQQ-binding-like beta-propeller repeat protein [Thermoleophilia bacterium]|nr:PQQ-binding-like beta-propeller repeat protein [Thermoleophilia bacterium]